MDLELISPNDEPQLKKSLFYLKELRSNSVMLQIYPSFIDSCKTKKKCRFLHCSFSEKNMLALSDSNGSIYIIDLEMQKYWHIPHIGIVSALSFPQLMKSKLLIALNTGAIEILHIETGNKTGTLTGHSVSVREISYSYDGKHCLTSNSAEAILWDLLSCTQAQKLSLKGDILLKLALFMPVHDCIFACFQDDAMQVWKFGSFECVKQIKPDGWKTHHLKSIAFTKNGRVMAVGGCTPNIVIFCLDTWTVKKIIELPNRNHGIKHMEFLPQPFDGGANKILGIVSNNSEICFLDIESSSFLNSMLSLNKLIGHFSVSPTGKYFVTIHISGEANVYMSQKIFATGENTSVNLHSITSPVRRNFNISAYEYGSKNKNLKQKWMEELNAVHDQLREELTLKKLIPILRQYGEYPDSYRSIIWRTILQLPLNKEAYVSLSGKECHPSYMNIEHKYPLINRSLSNILKRILSSLAYWCPLFSEVTFLPEFVFPFVKLLHFDPFVCFESVTTIIVNWCQNWFEFYPFPPINVLSIIENVLAYHDPDLLEFYYRKNVTSCIYACILMQTAFSEVLTKSEWLRLWDHILSNEPSFLFMNVVAYNIVCRNVIKNCDTSQDIESFFHSQNPIDVKLLISKSYYFVDKTPPDIHPRQYLTPFSSLKKGSTYMSYEAYPKLILDKNVSKLQNIEKEEEKIIQEQRKAIAMKKELDEKMRTDQKAEFREEVLTELDEKFKQIVNIEQERLSAQRRKLQNLRRELKLKELSVLEEVRSEMLKKEGQRKEIEMERLLKDIEAKKEMASRELKAIEEEISKYYSSLRLHKYRLKLDLKLNDEDKPKSISEDLRSEEKKLKEELDEFQDEIALAYDDNKIVLCNKIKKITEMLQRIEAEIAQEMNKKIISKRHVKESEVNRLWKETNCLEKKLETVMSRLLLEKHNQNGEGTEETLDVKEKYSTSTPSEHTEPDTDETKEKTSLVLVGNNSSKSSLKLDVSEKREKTISCPRNFWQNLNFSHENAAHETQKQDGHNHSKLKKQGYVDRENRKFKIKSNPVTQAKLKSIFTDCSDIQSPKLISDNCERSFSESRSGNYAHDLSDATSMKNSGFKICEIHGEFGPRGDVKCVSEGRRCSENSFSDNTFAMLVYERDTLSRSSDSADFVMKMALSERQKLVEDAKRFEFCTNT